MPRIPMIERTGVQHVGQNVHMQGAPGMEYGMRNARGLANAAGQLNDVADDSMRVFGAVKEFAEKTQHAQDNLAATEADTLFQQLTGDLQTRMAEEPHRYEEFKQWAKDTYAYYDEQVKPILEKMSPQFREQYAARAQGRNVEANTRFTLIGTQAKVTAMKDQTMSQLKIAADRQDAPTYKNVVESMTGIMFSEEQAKTLLLQYDNLADSAAAKKLVDSENPNAVDVLKERDGDGNYANFKAMKDDYRDRLIRVAETQKRQRIDAMDDEVLGSFLEGSPKYATADSLKQALDAGKIDQAQFNKYSGWQKSYRNELASAEKAKQTAEQKAKSDLSKQNASALKYRADTTVFSSNPEIAIRQADELLNLADQSVTELDDLMSVRKYIQERMRKAGDDEFNTANGKPVLDFIKKSYQSAEGFQGLKWDPWGPKKDDSQEFMQARYYEVSDLARQRLREGKSYGEVISEVKDLVAQLNSGDIKEIIRPNKNVNYELRYDKKSGRVAVWSPNREFLGWMDEMRNLPENGYVEPERKGATQEPAENKSKKQEVPLSAPKDMGVISRAAIPMMPH